MSAAIEPILAAADLAKYFGRTPALRGVDIQIAAGEVLAVMGPSGSGKSTLLHCLAGILRPDSGQIWFDGQRIDSLGERVYVPDAQSLHAISQTNDQLASYPEYLDLRARRSRYSG